MIGYAHVAAHSRIRMDRFRMERPLRHGWPGTRQDLELPDGKRVSIGNKNAAEVEVHQWRVAKT